MRNILSFIIILLAIGAAVLYSVNLYSGKKITDSPFMTIEIQKDKTAPAETAPAPQTEAVPAQEQPAAETGQTEDIYSRIDKMEENLNTKLGAISESSDKTEILARFDQLSKELEADVTLILSAVNKKEQWYRNEFYQVLAAIAAVFVLMVSVVLMMYISLKKIMLKTSYAPSRPAASVTAASESSSEGQTDDENPILTAVGSVSEKLAAKISETQYLFDPEKAVKLTSKQKSELIEITEEILFLDKAGCKPSPEEYYLLALERFSDKSFTEATVLFEHLKQKDETFSQAWYMTGYMEYTSRKYETAYEDLAKACAIDTDNFTYLTAFGNACLKLKKYTEAAEAFHKASSINGKDPAVWNNLAHSYILSGKAEEAAEAFAKAVELKPDFHEALHNLGLSLSRLKKYDEAVEAFEKAVAVKPDKHESMYNAACVYALLGKRDGALSYLKKAVDLSPDYAKKAKQDKDFESFAGDAEFTKITG
ncbi:MAG: tetratricopeptide repeat protein [Deferribacterales bacterium]